MKQLGAGDIGGLEVASSGESTFVPMYNRGREKIYRSRYQSYDNLVIVKQASDLSGTLDSTKLYMLDGTIDMGSQSIEVPAGGLSIAGLNGARDPFGLYSSADNYTLFTSPAGGYSGDLVIESLTIEVTGAGSKVFDLDNDGNGHAVDITGINFVSCTSLGELTDYRQLLFNNIGFIALDDGLTFNGAWTGIAVTTSIAIVLPAMTLFKEGAGFTVNNIRSDINFLSVNADAVLFDFQESNVTAKGGFSLTNVRTNATNAIPNFPSSSTYARFRDCAGIRNTYVGAQWYISSAAATNLSSVAVSTPLKIAGTTAYADEQWFTHSTDNSAVYEGAQMIDVIVQGTLSFSGTNGDVINIYIRQWDDSASSYINLPETAGSTLNAAGRAEGVSFIGMGTISTNDRIELWVENETGARNVTALVNGYVVISERAS